MNYFKQKSPSLLMRDRTWAGRAEVSPLNGYLFGSSLNLRQHIAVRYSASTPQFKPSPEECSHQPILNTQRTAFLDRAGLSQAVLLWCKHPEHSDLLPAGLKKSQADHSFLQAQPASGVAPSGVPSY